MNADRLVDRLTRRVEQLVAHPLSGRALDRFQRNDLRELIEAPYRVVYVVLQDRIAILTVRDTRRVLPRNPDAL